MPVTNHLKHKSELWEVPVLWEKNRIANQDPSPPPKGLTLVFPFHIKMFCDLSRMNWSPGNGIAATEEREFFPIPLFSFKC